MLHFQFTIQLTRSGLELNRNCRIFVPMAPLGGSSNAVKARVDKRTFGALKGVANKLSKIPYGNQMID
jgi:hypothetical protein